MSAQATTVIARVAPDDATAVRSPVGEVLRDITRGGLAGAIVGVLVAGVGGRIVMRLAALLVPAATGNATENGNRIGEITLTGSLGLLIFALVVGLVGGTIWVVVSPWIPGIGLRRAIVAMPIAVGLVATGLIEGSNPDFLILRHDVAVVALLVGLVALVGFAIAMVDTWLDGRLPHPGLGWRGAAGIYAVVAFAGAVLFALPITLTFLGSSDPSTLSRGMTLIVVAGFTIALWMYRIRGRTMPAREAMAARLALVVAVLVGFAATIPEIVGALGVT